MKQKLIFLATGLFFNTSLANLELITWQGTYYQAIPVKTGITKKYCNEHTPGTFIHTIKSAFAHPLITDKGIKLSDPVFNVDKIDGIYLIHGSFLATGESKDIPWQDHIDYFFYKFTEAGITKGVWYTNECKGLYKGIAIGNKNPQHIQQS